MRALGLVSTTPFTTPLKNNYYNYGSVYSSGSRTDNFPLFVRQCSRYTEYIPSIYGSIGT